MGAAVLMEEIKVNASALMQAIEAIKRLPVQCDFETADRWVGIVMLLESMLQNQPDEAEHEGE